jgi:hypothetical protein
MDILRPRPRRPTVPKFAHDRALHYLAGRQCELPDGVRRERTTLLALSGVLSKIQIHHGPESPAPRSRMILISSGLKPAFAGCSVRKLQ